jgi:hypothetical protein
MRKLLYALTFVALLAVGAWAQQSGGAFIPSFNYEIPGSWTFSGANTFSGINTVSGAILRPGWTTQLGHGAKVGSAAGWVVGAATNLPYVATMAASQTAGTLVLPVLGLHPGDVITGFRIVAQVESAGGIVTIDAALRAVTNVAAEPTDAGIGTGITQVSVTADTAVSAVKTGLTEVVTSGKTYYILVTATTAASTDIILQASEITVTEW